MSVTKGRGRKEAYRGGTDEAKESRGNPFKSEGAADEAG